VATSCRLQQHYRQNYSGSLAHRWVCWAANSDGDVVVGQIAVHGTDGQYRAQYVVTVPMRTH
jgi:ribosomal protein L35AE/L33A